MKTEAVLKTLREIRRLLNLESKAIDAKDYGEITKIVPDKELLLSRCTEFLAEFTRVDTPDKIAAELEAVRRKAEENAQSLQNLREGVAAAQRRLASVAESDCQVNWYTDKISNGARAAAMRALESRGS